AKGASRLSRRKVGGQPRTAPQTSRGRDIHNGAPARLPHRRNGMFGPQKYPFGVDGHDVLPLRFAGLLEALPEHNPSVIHQDIELAIAVDRRAHRLDPISVAGHIQMQVRRFAASGTYLGLDLFPLSIPDVAQDHLRAFTGKQFRLCRALAPGAAADQGHLPIEPSHVSLLVLGGLLVLSWGADAPPALWPVPARAIDSLSTRWLSTIRGWLQGMPGVSYAEVWTTCKTVVCPLGRPSRWRLLGRSSAPCSLASLCSIPRRRRRWSMSRDALGSAGHPCTEAGAPVPHGRA